MKIVFIVPRFGPNVVGGAEWLAQQLAQQLNHQEHHIEIWTSCANDYNSWENVFPPGEETLSGISVVRFPISHFEKKAHNQASENIQAGSFNKNVELNWLQTGAHSLPLYHHIITHKSDVDLFILLPYLSTITQYAAWLVPEKSIFIPCMHDESYAYMQSLHLLLEHVSGLLFLTPEEEQFTLNTLQLKLKRHQIIGAGINPPPLVTDTPHPSTPYLLSMSRLEKEKNLGILYEYAQRYVDEGGKLKVVLLGTGSYIPPEHPVFEYRGFVSNEEKFSLAENALAICHPSLNESFSFAIMESWQMGRPVMVHKDCAITGGHVKRSGGGFSFSTYGEFATIVTWMLANPEETAVLGQNGKAYVEKNYNWPTITKRFLTTIESWIM